METMKRDCGKTAPFQGYCKHEVASKKNSPVKKRKTLFSRI
jgi:hypothetical protein